MALALFAADTHRESLGFVAGFGEDRLRRDEGLSDLEVLSLCHKNGDHFGLEPLTRTQALTELHSHPEFEAAARERWVEWYLNLTAHYGGRDGLEMHLRYDHLEETGTTFSPCALVHGSGRYDDSNLWDHVRDFTHIYGFWTDP
jgi:LuxR family glucitol operon transcriptional activator